MRLTKRLLMALIVATCLQLVADTSSRASLAVIPNPVLYLKGTEYYTAGGQNFIRYKYGVDNFQQFPDELFAAAPNLPPCGANTRSSRSWVDFYTMSGKRLYGFCALGKSENLNSIWFALPDGEVPPSYIYIEINDRQTNTKYKSNLADTTQ